MILIQPTTGAVKRTVTIHLHRVNTSLGILGILEETEDILLEIPTVLSPDVNNDSHWTSLNCNDITFTLTKHKNRLVFAGSIGKIRINKPVTSNPVGVVWLW